MLTDTDTLTATPTTRADFRALCRHLGDKVSYAVSQTEGISVYECADCGETGTWTFFHGAVCDADEEVRDLASDERGAPWADTRDGVDEDISFLRTLAAVLL